MSEKRTQYYIDPVTNERKAIKVRSITHKFRKGKGGALAGAIPTAADESQVGTPLKKKPAEDPAK